MSNQKLDYFYGVIQYHQTKMSKLGVSLFFLTMRGCASGLRGREEKKTNLCPLVFATSLMLLYLISSDAHKLETWNLRIMMLSAEVIPLQRHCDWACRL